MKTEAMKAKLSELEHAKALVEALVQLPHEAEIDRSASEVLALKLDALNGVLERIRGATGLAKGYSHTWPAIHLAFADNEDRRLIFATGTGDAPAPKPWSREALMPRLLVYLHDSEAAGLPVQEILRTFKHSMQQRLGDADHATTSSGVLRFHINAKFAASTLRRMGLLLDTPDERFHTWRLSLGGILAAKEIIRAMNTQPLHKEWQSAQDWGEISLLSWLHRRWHASFWQMQGDLEKLVIKAVPETLPQAQANVFLNDWISEMSAAMGHPVFGKPAPSPAALKIVLQKLAVDPHAVHLAQAWAGYDAGS